MKGTVMDFSDFASYFVYVSYWYVIKMLVIYLT